MATKIIPEVAVVDFHHARGPEVEFWVQPSGTDLFNTNDWSLLPFLALADGAHAVEQEFSYFTLLSENVENKDSKPAVEAKSPGRSLFGIACMRQIKSDKLKVRSAAVTRSTVQKAVIVILETPAKLGQVRERLGAVTGAWFGQADFTNIEVLQDFQDSLIRDAASDSNIGHDDYFGLSIREMIFEFKHQALVLFKALLLQKKMLFFGSRCERLCLLQFALITLVPNLNKCLQDCADPSLDSYAQTITRAGSLRTSERTSLLAYMGLPLQVFGASSFFSPYTPLQMLDMLMSASVHSFVVGSTNNLLLSQRDSYADVLVNLDEESLSAKIQILNPALRGPLSLSAADRRWIDNIVQTVSDTWDASNPSRPTTHGYSGSEDAIRLQFEEYLLSLCSSAAYKDYHDSHSFGSSTATIMSNPEDFIDPLQTANDFNNEFLVAWRRTPNFALFDKLTRNASIFDVIPPKHPTAGGLNVEDVQRRLAQGVADLHLDERVREGRETVGRYLGEGRERVGAGVARFWKEVDGFRERREASRGRGGGEERRSSTSTGTDMSQIKDNITGFDPTTTTSTTTAPPPPSSSSSDGNVRGSNTNSSSWLTSVRDRATKLQLQRPDIDINTQQLGNSARENAAKAGAYISSWGSWARDRGKEWRNNPAGSTTTAADPSGSTGMGTGSGSGTGTGKDVG